LPVGVAIINKKIGEAEKSALLSRVHQLMQEAVALGDYKEVQRLARIAEELSILETKEKEIAQSRANLWALLENPLESKIDDDEVSARERGNRVRDQYIEGILATHKIQLHRISSKKYRTSDNRLIGLTYAKELEIRPSFWFLGLSDEHFDCVILLCESSDSSGAEIAALVLPPEFVRQIWKDLSRSKGQVKFHIARTGYMSFELSLPGSRRLNISQYLNAVHVLETRSPKQLRQNN
jgi:hypothetical protein